MEQRPPSARPKTSSGSRPGTASRRPKTAGRDSDRPPTRPPSMVQQRPPSRLGSEAAAGNQGNLPAAPSYERAVSRGNPNPVPLPASAMGLRSNRVESRSGQRTATSMMMRPGSGMAPSAAAVNQYFPPTPGTGIGNQRPITQQGVTGVRAQSRMGSSMGNRQVLDKTYYISVLNNQLRALEGEIDSLVNELEKTEKGQQNLLFYEQRAEEQANELKELQGELSDLNLIIDRQNTNSDLRDLEFELMESQKANHEVATAVEELFRERREKEDAIHDLEKKIERVRHQNNEQINNLEPEVKDEFERIKSEAENLKLQLEEKQQELGELNKAKEELDLALANSPLKQQAMVLEEQIQELAEKKNAILKELNSDGTPEEQRQALIDRIQRDNEEIAHMQSQLQEMNERMGQAQEELREFENEFEILAGDKSDKFRELKNRDAHMDAFLESFGQLSAEVEQKIGSLSVEVVRLLNLISINCRHNEIANVSGLDESFLSFSSAISNPSANAGELQDLHVRLQEELISLRTTESGLGVELEGMRRKQQEIEAAGQNSVDINSFKQEMEGKQRDLLDRSRQLRDKNSREEQENSRLLQQISETEQRFSQSALYAKLKELKKRVDVAEEEKRVLKEKVEAQLARNDYEPLKQGALKLRAEYNNVLITAYSNSSGHR